MEHNGQVLQSDPEREGGGDILHMDSNLRVIVFLKTNFDIQPIIIRRGTIHCTPKNLIFQTFWQGLINQALHFTQPISKNF